MPHHRFIHVWICVLIALAACTPSPPPVDPAAAAKAAAEAAAVKEARLYDQMRASQSWDIAASLGSEVLTRFPGTAAAAQVQQTLPEVRAKAARRAQSRRLANLWVYTATPEAGGTQYAAAIASRHAPAPGGRARLVLRQHPKWGQSVYLLLDNARFDCGKGCATLAISFDGKPAQRMPATIPPTGEPALFIDPDKRFIAAMEKAKQVVVDVTLKDVGDKKLEFEVGGFDPARYQPQKSKQARAKQ
ncbi:MAG TPA: hypothetical protein VFN13_05835 [Rudaea sp.]|nr:hypothetical protein [Rudaea sp.]